MVKTWWGSWREEARVVNPLAGLLAASVAPEPHPPGRAESRAESSFWLKPVALLVGIPFALPKGHNDEQEEQRRGHDARSRRGATQITM